MKYYSLFFLFLLLSFVHVSCVLASIHHVPDDFALIQSALDAASDGDTVLIQPGIYTQNLTISNDVTLASTYLFDPDTSIISETIIQGDSTSTVITAENVSIVLIGFTIQGGNNEDLGGGVYCNNTDFTAEHLVVCGNIGGGIYTQSGSASLSNISVHDNSGTTTGGICSNQTALEMAECRIANNFNSAYTGPGGGGICIENGNALLSDCEIVGNTCHEYGGGIFFQCETIAFSNVRIVRNSAKRGGGLSCFAFPDMVYWDPINKSDIYCNTAYEGTEIYQYGGSIEVVLDTFITEEATYFETSPLRYISVDADHAALSVIDGDIYVSPDGDNSNNGTSEETPLKSVFLALLRAAPNATVFLAPGIYSTQTTGELFPFPCKPPITVTGCDSAATVLDANGEFCVIMGYGSLDNDNNQITLNYLTIQNGRFGLYSRFIEADFTGLQVFYNQGGGLYIDGVNNRNHYLQDVEIAYGGLGLYEAGILNLAQCSIHDNVGSYEGGGIYVRNSLEMEECSIHHNYAPIGGGIYCYNYSESVFGESNSVYLNTCDGFGQDLYFDRNAEFAITGLDTFTTSAPVDWTAWSEDTTITFTVENWFCPIVAADLFVSPNGSDENDGLSFDSPLRTIDCAFSHIEARRDGVRTIFLDEGVFSPSVSGQQYPVYLHNGVNLVGSGRNLTILDAEGTAGVLIGETVQGCTLSDVTITGGQATYGGGAWLNNSEINFENVTFANNQANEDGGGVYGRSVSKFDFDRVLFTDNHANNEGGALYSFDGAINLTYSTFVNNNAPIGGAYRLGAGQIFIVNCITWGNGDLETVIYGYLTSYNSNYCQMPGGIQGEDNMSRDPMFVNPDSGDFRLQPGSPHIDAGAELVVAEEETLFVNHDLYLNDAPDIGTYEKGVFNLLLPADNVHYSDDYPGDVYFEWGTVARSGVALYTLVLHVEADSGEDTVLTESGMFASNVDLNLQERLDERFLDSPLTVTWYVEAIFNRAAHPCIEPFVFTVESLPVDDTDNTLPLQYEMSAFYPNPFNPVLSMEIALPEPSQVQVQVYDLLGRLVTTVTNKQYAAGWHSMQFDGHEYASGVYFFHIQAGNEFKQVRKAILLK